MKNSPLIRICFSIAFSLVLSLGLYFGKANAVENQGIQYSEYNPMEYSAFNSLATSTHQVAGLLTSYSIYPVGSTCSYHLQFATATFMNSATRALTYSLVTSSEATIPANMVLSNSPKIETWNPKIVVSGLATGATVYIFMDYGQYKTSWGGN